MFIKTIVVGNNFTNCYIVGEDKGTGILIDPGGNPEKIVDVIEKTGIEITKIINTHGHFDHIKGNDYLQDKTGAKIFIHRIEEDFLTRPEKNLSSLLGKGMKVISPEADGLLKDGDEIEVGRYILEVFHTPGHSPGSISLYCEEEDIILSGDTIFKMGIGRTDFPGCVEDDIFNSIENRLLKLNENTVVYPGHGEKTTIGDFKVNIWERLKR